MHEWEKQEKLLEKIEKHQLENCLVYNTFAYEKHEWDNIPGIVPRYIIYLSKYMAGVCEVTNDIYGREHVKDLRSDMENRIKSNLDMINSNRETDLKEKDAIKQGMDETNKNHTALKTLYEEQYKDATYLDEKECSSNFDTCMTSVIASRGKEADAVAANDVER